MPKKLRAVARGVAFLSLTFFLIATYPLAIAIGQGGRRVVRWIWCRATCWILGIKVTCEGRPFTSCPIMFVANHVSYIDVLALGGFVDATFIAKSEVKAWPLIGFIASCAGTMFIKRHWREALVQRNAIAARMRRGESFVLFAEGTSSNGLSVRPLKTSLLSVAEPWVLDCPVATQSVTLAYTRLADGRPHDRTTCDLYAWYDEMPFVPHLGAVLAAGGCTIAIRVHEPVMSWSVVSRKQLAPRLRGELMGSLHDLRGDVAERASRAATDLDAAGYSPAKS